jgi:hypothetical protein
MESIGLMLDDLDFAIDAFQVVGVDRVVVIVKSLSYSSSSRNKLV